jgi:hypothetical protein
MRYMRKNLLGKLAVVNRGSRFETKLYGTDSYMDSNRTPLFFKLDVEKPVPAGPSPLAGQPYINVAHPIPEWLLDE